MLISTIQAAGSASARLIEQAPSILPASFNDGASLFLFNLFAMTAMTFLAAMMVGKQATRIWSQRLFDHPLDPVTLYRAILLLAGFGLALRCGAEAMFLWGYDPLDPITSARVSMAKRWIDPIGLGCAMLWMMTAILAEPGIELQLRKAPLPVKIDMWSRWPVLVRSACVIILSFVAALAAVCLR